MKRNLLLLLITVLFIIACKKNVSDPASDISNASQTMVVQKINNLQIGKIQSLVLDTADATLQSRPALVRSNNGYLVCFYMKAIGDVYYKISTDFGKTWGGADCCLYECYTIG